MVDITPPTAGDINWDVPLNAALVALENAVTATETSTSTLRGAVFNVKDATYGAVGNGSTNDTTAVQSAINAASAAGGGIVYFPPGTYPGNWTVPVNVNLVGSGRRATVLRKSVAGTPLIDMSGPSTDASGATHVRYSGVHAMTLNGNGLTGAVLRCYYTDNCVFRDVYFSSSTEQLVDGVEFWDSRFLNCVFESSGGTNSATLPAVWLRNASSATPATFGYSADNVNQIVFHACRWENFHNGALRIEDGSVAGNNPNTIYLLNCKMETSQMQGGSHLFVDDACRAIWVNNLYLYAGGFTGGFSTAQNIIDWSAQGSTLENVLISNGAVATVNSGVVLFSPAGQCSVLRNVISRYSTAPTGNHIFFSASSTGSHFLENCTSGTGSQYGGTVPTSWEGGQPIKQVAGVPVDGSFVRTPINGVGAYDTTNGNQYLRIGGSWISTGPGALVRAAAGTNAYGTRVTGDANNRFQGTAGGTLEWGDGTAAVDTNLYRGAANRLQTDDTFRIGAAALLEFGAAGDVNLYATGGNLQTDDYFVMPTGQSSGTFNIFGGTASALTLGTAGGGINIKTGSNARLGTATLVAGTVTVANTSVTANTKVFLSRATTGGTVGHLSYTKINATSFTINSNSGTETSTVDWILVEAS